LPEKDISAKETHKSVKEISIPFTDLYELVGDLPISSGKIRKRRRGLTTLPVCLPRGANGQTEESKRKVSGKEPC